MSCEQTGKRPLSAEISRVASIEFLRGEFTWYSGDVRFWGCFYIMVNRILCVLLVIALSAWMPFMPQPVFADDYDWQDGDVVPMNLIFYNDDYKGLVESDPIFSHVSQSQ